MKRAFALLIAATVSSPALAQGGFFGAFAGEDRSVLFTVAADYVNSTVSLSNTDTLPSNESFSSDFVNVKLGLRPQNFSGRGSFLTFEAHVGVGLRDDGDPGDAETDSYFGLFVVPHAVVLDMFEISFPIGYARSKVSVGGSDDTFDSVSFGGNVMLPLRLFFPNFLDIRVSAGGQVYHQDSQARIYGYNVGLRWDF